MKKTKLFNKNKLYLGFFFAGTFSKRIVGLGFDAFIGVGNIRCFGSTSIRKRKMSKALANELVINPIATYLNADTLKLQIIKENRKKSGLQLYLRSEKF